MEMFKTAVELLQTSGPYAILVFLGYAYWHKDQQLSTLYRELIGMIESQTQASTKMEAALLGLRDIIQAATTTIRKR